MRSWLVSLYKQEKSCRKKILKKEAEQGKYNGEESGALFQNLKDPNSKVHLQIGVEWRFKFKSFSIYP